MSRSAISSDEESTLFEYHLKPTFDFYQLILAQANQLEIIEPEAVREEMRGLALHILKFYDKP